MFTLGLAQCTEVGEGFWRPDEKAASSEAWAATGRCRRSSGCEFFVGGRDANGEQRSGARCDGGGLNQEFDGGMPNVAVLAQAMADANEIISIAKCKALGAILIRWIGFRNPKLSRLIFGVVHRP